MTDLDHPHILRLISWYEQEDSMAMVCDFCAGGELMDAVREGRKQTAVPEKWAAVVFRQLFDALVYCHSRGVVHKDLKSDNILLLHEPPADCEIFSVLPHAIIADWGLSEIVSEGGFFEVKGHEVAGTGFTMAPEVWKGSCGQKADIWSLGCVLFQLLSNKMPFDPPEAALATLTRAAKANVWIEFHNKGPNWNLMEEASKEVIHLCQGMLTVREKDRLRAQKCREHKWIIKHSSWSLAPKNEFSNICKTICTWHQRHPFQKAMCLKLAAACCDTSSLATIFSTLDTDHNGALSKQEILNGLQALGVDNSVARTTAAALDFKGMGECSWLEFLASCLPALGEDFSKLVAGEFRLLSVSSKGGLTSPMVASYFDTLMSLADVKADVPELVPNKTSRVSLKEFAAFFGQEPRQYRGSIKHGPSPTRAMKQAKRAPKVKASAKPKVVRPAEPMEAIVHMTYARQIVEPTAKSDDGSSWGSGSWCSDDDDDDETETEAGEGMSSAVSNQTAVTQCWSKDSPGKPDAVQRRQVTDSAYTTQRLWATTATPQPTSPTRPSHRCTSQSGGNASLLSPTWAAQKPQLENSISEGSTAEPVPASKDGMKSALLHPSQSSTVATRSQGNGQVVPTMLEGMAGEEVRVSEAKADHTQASRLVRRALNVGSKTISLGEHYTFMDSVEFREALSERFHILLSGEVGTGVLPKRVISL
mmetsp:Transcript_12525/g.44352  ORF Transcript_12525/g.44352 Transcript_12525/m.44352 type:complete len:704 (-) Transcript_12525:70-2181(-)